jgi:hypothetical protein
MRIRVIKTIVIGLSAIAFNVVAAPEMRCRLDGAYIKVYGKNEAEQREVCGRQGGEFVPYVPQVSRGPDPRAKANEAVFGRNLGSQRY